MGLYPPDEVKSILEAVGFNRINILKAKDINAVHFLDREDGLIFPTEAYLVDAMRKG